MQDGICDVDEGGFNIDITRILASCHYAICWHTIDLVILVLSPPKHVHGVTFRNLVLAGPTQHICSYTYRGHSFSLQASRPPGFCRQALWPPCDRTWSPEWARGHHESRYYAMRSAVLLPIGMRVQRSNVARWESDDQQDQSPRGSQ